MKKLFIPLFVVIFFTSCETEKKKSIEKLEPAIWSEEKAWSWYAEQPWMVGANFNPSYSINQLEFWQAETFDLEAIDRELKWSADIGMNLHRVYLHNLLWDQDSVGFMKRMDQFLDLCEKYNIRMMPVLFDDVWHPVPKLGKQPDPIPHVHNSGWVQAPGAAILGDSSRHDSLKGYVKGIVGRFGNDPRVALWDLYNEPNNVAKRPGRKELEVKDKHIYSLALLKKVNKWAREVKPSQPLTVGIWHGKSHAWGERDSLTVLQRYMIDNSDVISFHAYDDTAEKIMKKITGLQKYNRPLLCTEYMARTNNNRFDNVLPIFKEHNIAAINWGFVSGKSNTIYPWKSWSESFDAEPEIWFHDVFRQDGTPYDSAEIQLIKQLTDR